MCQIRPPDGEPQVNPNLVNPMRPMIVLSTLTVVVMAASVSTVAHAATGCNSMWAQEFAIQNGITKCQDPTQTVACDKNDDGDTTDAGDTCTVNELLNEHHKDPLYGELIDDSADSDGDGDVLEFSGDIAPGGSDGNMSARLVPLCADGGNTCPGEELRCVDGTRPIYYIDPADDLTSDNWLIAFQGGGGCGKTDTETGGESCWSSYQDADDRGGMSTTLLSGAEVHGLKRSLNGSGVLDDRASNEFNDYHRIKVHKCSYDRSSGQIMRTHLSGTDRDVDDDTTDGKPSAVIDSSTGEVGKFNLPFHGWFIVQAILEDLKDGPVVTVYDESGTADLPRMDDADTVLLAGHSGGSVGVVQKADAMKAILVDDWGTSAEVLALLDARARPHIDHETFLTDGGASGDNFYDYVATSVACDSATQACLPGHGAIPEADYSDDKYDTGGAIHSQAKYRKEFTDASCLAQHKFTKDTWRCRSADHVMYHHIEVPFFLRQSQRDSNQSGKAPEWTAAAYTWKTSEYRRRVVDQVLAFMDERDKASADQDWEEDLYDWAQPSDVGLGLFLPNTTKHAGMYNNEHFFNVYLTDGTDCASYHDALWDWINTGEQVWVEDEDGVSDGTGVCP